MEPLCLRLLESAGNSAAEFDALLAEPDARRVLLGHSGGTLLQAVVDRLGRAEAAGSLAALSDLAGRLVDTLPPALSLSALLSRWRHCESGRPLAALVRLTVRFLTAGRPGAFLREGGADTAEDEAVAHWLVNLPTTVANRLGSSLLQSSADYPDVLNQAACFRLLSGVIVDCLRSPAAASVSRCGHLAGLLCLRGGVAVFWEAVSMGKTTLPAGAISRLLTEVRPGHTESCLTRLVSACDDFETFYGYLGDLVVRDASARMLLSDKLIFARRFTNSTLPARNLARYLHRADWQLFGKTLLEAASVWSQPSVVRSNGIEQHRHITWFMVVATRLLAADADVRRVRPLRDQLVTILVPGIAAHFEHNADAFRVVGMATGEVITDLLGLSGGGEDGERRLKFDCPDCPDSDMIRRLAYSDVNFVEGESSLLTTQATASLKPANTIASDNPSSQPSNQPLLDSDDDEDELQPMQASLATDGPAADANRPRYMRQLLDGLQATAPEERDRLQASLDAARRLISEHPGAARELSLDLAGALLCLNADSEAIEGSAEKRMAALTELVCADSASVAPYLAQQVFAPEYCIGQRLDALQALQTGALALARRPPPTPESDHRHGSVATPTPNSGSRHPVGRVIRRWGQRSKPEPPAAPNAFHAHAGAFFFGLAQGFDTRERHLDLTGPDHQVLCRLLYTMGVVYFCSENAPVQERMLSALMQLLPGLRAHPEATVRRGALFCYACVGLATPSRALVMPELAAISAEAVSALADGIDDEPDGECRELAVAAGRLMAGRLAGYLAGPLEGMVD